MHWNHRVMRYQDGTLGIHEIYHMETQDQQEKSLPAYLWSEYAVCVLGEDLDGLRKTLQRMLECLDKPILEYGTPA